ncbi:PDDEXK nuclease domain-containing protein [uncultured Mucilaginibacter sp.]|uniref:PDDEXK nuclease domain-containing protein n=1 Tax=uncultured Mucilaginibacter sp. TaxID=797541 RepID=UPI002631D60B|nr:PDDEXK nuclease domain-containing protein [uncultured Mucilaginibacter sp.]
MEELINADYKDWLVEIKSKIRSSQIKAAIAVNSALIQFYWDLGKMITEKQAQTQWGDGLLMQLSHDLKREFPEMKGLSYRNLNYARQFYQFYKDAIVQQVVAQIPWGHNILIISKLKNLEEAQFYLQQTIENNWSRDVLGLQIKSNLYNRKGKSVTNFKQTLPKPFSDLAQQTLNDPYIFDFLTLTTKAREKDIENQLIRHITQFLLELGKGFAFIGQQYHLEVAEEDYYLDLLFYNVPLKCYVVIELKNTKFIPEYAGKLNFYLSVVDDLLKKADDRPTIGMLLCRDKNNIAVEYALRDMSKPMGVSEFQFTEILPENIKSSLPSVEELENELKNLK